MKKCIACLMKKEQIVKLKAALTTEREKSARLLEALKFAMTEIITVVEWE